MLRFRYLFKDIQHWSISAALVFRLFLMRFLINFYIFPASWPTDTWSNSGIDLSKAKLFAVDRHIFDNLSS